MYRYLKDVDQLPRSGLVSLVEVSVRNPLLTGATGPAYPVNVVLWKGAANVGGGEGTGWGPPRL